MYLFKLIRADGLSIGWQPSLADARALIRFRLGDEQSLPGGSVEMHEIEMHEGTACNWLNNLERPLEFPNGGEPVKVWDIGQDGTLTARPSEHVITHYRCDHCGAVDELFFQINARWNAYRNEFEPLTGDDASPSIILCAACEATNPVYETFTE